MGKESDCMNFELSYDAEKAIRTRLKEMQGKLQQAENRQTKLDQDALRKRADSFMDKHEAMCDGGETNAIIAVFAYVELDEKEKQIRPVARLQGKIGAI